MCVGRIYSSPVLKAEGRFSVHVQVFRLYIFLNVIFFGFKCIEMMMSNTYRSIRSDTSNAPFPFFFHQTQLERSYAFLQVKSKVRDSRNSQYSFNYVLQNHRVRFNETWPRSLVEGIHIWSNARPCPLPKRKSIISPEPLGQFQCNLAQNTRNMRRSGLLQGEINVKQ